MDSSSQSGDGYHLPETGISEIMGLIELLKSKGGHEDIYKLANELKIEFGETLSVIRSAELLKLVHTPGGDVVLEPLGEKLSKSKMNARKAVIKEQIKTVPVFVKIKEYLAQKENQRATRSEVMAKIAELMPNENAEKSFSHFINWARYGEVFGYDTDTQTFYID